MRSKASCTWISVCEAKVSSLERLSKACGGRGGVSQITDFGFTRIVGFRFEAGDLQLEFAFLIAQALCEAFDIHSSDDNPVGTSQRLIALIGLAG